jgi:hypothetical protein
MMEANFVPCPGCGKHGDIVFSDNTPPMLILSQFTARALIDVLVARGDISEENASILHSQLKISNVPEESTVLDILALVNGAQAKVIAIKRAPHQPTINPLGSPSMRSAPMVS